MKAETQTISITLNGKPQEIQSGMTVTALLTKWRMRPELVTVEINEMILQKLDYDTTEIKQGDKVEFIFYMGGGSGERVLPRRSPTVRKWIPCEPWGGPASRHPFATDQELPQRKG